MALYVFSVDFFNHYIAGNLGGKWFESSCKEEGDIYKSL